MLIPGLKRSFGSSSRMFYSDYFKEMYPGFINLLTYPSKGRSSKVKVT